MRRPKSTTIPPDAPAARCVTPWCRHAGFSHSLDRDSLARGACRYCDCAAFTSRGSDALHDGVRFRLTQLGERALETAR